MQGRIRSDARLHCGVTWGWVVLRPVKALFLFFLSDAVCVLSAMFFFVALRLFPPLHRWLGV